MKEKAYTLIARTLQARNSCEETGNDIWYEKHSDRLSEIVQYFAPSGSGFDSGTKLSPTSRVDRLVFSTSFHHMTEHGMYDGWTDHDVVITPSLANGFDLRVTGRDRNDIKDYIADVFHTFLDSMIEITETTVKQVTC